MNTTDTSCKMVNIYLYSRYERSWHWLQSALIMILLGLKPLLFKKKGDWRERLTEAEKEGG